jgi:predicted nucleotide-binding protein (sugar kinase/HSP70/actin superfamily)
LNKTREILERYYKDSKKYVYIILELGLIAKIIEKESNLTWSKLDEFKNRSDIKNSVQTLKDKFAEDLKRSEQKSEEDKELKNEQ